MEPSTSNTTPTPVVARNTTTNTTSHPISISSPTRLLQPSVNEYSVNLTPVACQPFSPLPTITQTQETTHVPREVNVPVNSTVSSVLLHHEDESHYIFPDYCMTVDESLASTHEQCKYTKKKCLVHRMGLFTHGQKQTTLSHTVFTPNPKFMKKNTYSLLDTRLLSCCSPICRDSKTSEPKMFHYCCFRHSLGMKENSNMDMITVNKDSHVLLSNLENKSNILGTLCEQAGSGIKFVLPVCSKTCYNRLNDEKKDKEKDKGTVSSDGTPMNWEKDGRDGKMSSAAVVVNWLTTEENASSYFGGVDKRGKTNSKRKETYHTLLSMLIHKENGK